MYVEKCVVDVGVCDLRIESPPRYKPNGGSLVVTFLPVCFCLCDPEGGVESPSKSEFVHESAYLFPVSEYIIGQYTRCCIFSSYPHPLTVHFVHSIPPYLAHHRFLCWTLSPVTWSRGVAYLAVIFHDSFHACVPILVFHAASLFGGLNFSIVLALVIILVVYS